MESNIKRLLPITETEILNLWFKCTALYGKMQEIGLIEIIS